ncbi:GntR family transcriptional regulator [Nitrosomonas sp. PY1]|uniref:DoxX family protein n=1 Tax=Nitrosomonas sp. PY1 TaxID=1803906 RepID=UPI001FC809EA|nr:DoxX family protein [Nitrosomonas sp. PY1]GKS70414.1 GntR family transcriptional regulator [Nitrosomonas sp. PY1]
MNLPFQSDTFGKLTLRLTVGFLMLFHGVHKLFNPSSLDFIGKRLADMNLPQVLAYGVYVGEVIAPLMIILGVFSRLGGLFVVGNMIFAIMLAHRDQLYSLTDHGGHALELQVFFLLTGLVVFFLGSGRFAVKPD